MKNFFASAAVLSSFSQFMCLFCCVVPTATGIIAILSALGLTGTNAVFLGDLSIMVHPYRETIMWVSISLISLSWALWFYGYRQSKKPDCECNKKKTKKPIFLSIATAFLVFNIAAMPFLH